MNMPAMFAAAVLAGSGAAAAQQPQTSEFETITVSLSEGTVFVNEDNDGVTGNVTVTVDAISCTLEWRGGQDFVEIRDRGGNPTKRVVITATADFDLREIEQFCSEDSPEVEEISVLCGNSIGENTFVQRVFGARTVTVTGDDREVSTLDATTAAMDCTVQLNGAELTAEGSFEGSTIAQRNVLRTR